VALLELPSVFSLLPLESSESISSMNIMHGVYLLASANNSLTLLAPIPTYISSNYEPEQ
jgi:hypothetical protein